MDFPFKLLLTPIMIVWALLFTTVLWSWFRHRRVDRPALVSLLIFWLFSTKPIVDQFAIPLEMAYPAFQQQPLAHIVVLGCNHQDSSFLPLSSRPDLCSLVRLDEAIRLWHQQPQALLHVSGHIANRIQSHTDMARQYAIAMGVAPEKIVSHSDANNTRTEIEVLSKVIAQQPTALVTSALHMPRSCNWMAFYGGRVIAAPTDYHVRRFTSDIGWQGWIPSVQSLTTLSYALYEYMGLVQQYFQIRNAQPVSPAKSGTDPVTVVGCSLAG